MRHLGAKFDYVVTDIPEDLKRKCQKNIERID